MSAKTTYQRSAKGPLTISDCSSDGRFITLENTGKKLEELTGWRVVRNIDNDSKKRIEYTFSTLSLRPGQRIKVPLLFYFVFFFLSIFILFLTSVIFLLAVSALVLFKLNFLYKILMPYNIQYKAFFLSILILTKFHLFFYPSLLLLPI